MGSGVGRLATPTTSQHLKCRYETLLVDSGLPSNSLLALIPAPPMMAMAVRGARLMGERRRRGAREAQQAARGAKLVRRGSVVPAETRELAAQRVLQVVRERQAWLARAERQAWLARAERQAWLARAERQAWPAREERQAWPAKAARQRAETLARPVWEEALARPVWRKRWRGRCGRKRWRGRCGRKRWRGRCGRKRRRNLRYHL